MCDREILEVAGGFAMGSMGVLMLVVAAHFFIDLIWRKRGQ